MATTMQNYAQSEYVADRVLTAPPMELIRMLYQGACESVDVAIARFEANDIIGRGKAITKAMSIIFELRGALRDGPYPEYAANLADLYGYLHQRLIHAHARKDKAALAEAARLLRRLRDNWTEVMQYVMGGTEMAAMEAEAAAAQHGAIVVSPYELAFAPERQSRSWQA